jgi:predicted lipid-binding transport protein (Tim44 family)
MPQIDFATVIFAVIAIVVAVRLYMTLGTNAQADSEPGPNVVNLRRAPSPPPSATDATPTAEPDDSLRWRGAAPAGSPVEAGLKAIAAADPAFDARSFLSGAVGAYALIVKGFAAGDVAALSAYLAPDVLKLFSDQIASRKAAGRVASVALIGATQATIDSASLEGGHAHVVVRFVAKLLSATRDASGAVVEGSADNPEGHCDLWTFARDPASADPNWILLATEAVAAA